MTFKTSYRSWRIRKHILHGFFNSSLHKKAYQNVPNMFVDIFNCTKPNSYSYLIKILKTPLKKNIPARPEPPQELDGIIVQSGKSCYVDQIIKWMVHLVSFQFGYYKQIISPLFQYSVSGYWRKILLVYSRRKKGGMSFLLVPMEFLEQQR